MEEGEVKVPIKPDGQLKVKEKVSLIGMGQKFEVWNEKNWLAKEKGQQIQGEKLDIDLPSNVQEIPF